MLRQGDLLARWGGEEFAFAIVGASAEAAAEVLDRVRLELSVRLSTSDIPGFTASFGVVDTGPGASLDEAVRLAISTMQSVLTSDFKASEIEIALVCKGERVRLLTEADIEAHLSALAEAE